MGKLIYGAIAAVAIVLIAFVFGLFDVDVTGETELPDVDVSVEGGELPEVDADVADVTVGTETEEVTVPDVDVDVSTEEAEVEVPTVSVEPADAEENN